MTTLTEIKRTVRPGDVFDVTNHYIRRPDHPCYGTSRREVVKVNTSALYLGYPRGASMNTSPGRRAAGSRIEWPRASQVQRDTDGTIRIYGGGIGQVAGELFLTLVPVSSGNTSEPSEEPGNPCSVPELDQETSET